MRYLKINDWINPKVLFKICVAGVIILIILPVIKHIIFEFLKDKSEGAIFFSNIATPVITAFALIVYYLSLQQMKKQTAVLVQEKNLLRGDNIYKEMIISIQNIKIKYENINLNEKPEPNFSIKSETVFSIGKSKYLHDLTNLIKNNPDYKNCLTQEKFDIHNPHDDISTSLFNIPYYFRFLDIYICLDDFLTIIENLLHQIKNNKDLDTSHQNLLFKRIADTLLGDYFTLIKNFKDKYNLKLPFLSDNYEYFINSVFESFKLDRVYRFYETKNPNMIDDSISLYC